MTVGEIGDGKKGVEKQREQAREEARKLLGELEGNEIDDYDDMDECRRVVVVRRNKKVICQ